MQKGSSPPGLPPEQWCLSPSLEPHPTPARYSSLNLLTMGKSHHPDSTPPFPVCFADSQALLQVRNYHYWTLPHSPWAARPQPPPECHVLTHTREAAPASPSS